MIAELARTAEAGDQMGSGERLLTQVSFCLTGSRDPGEREDSLCKLWPLPL